MDKTQKVYDFIENYIENNGFPPTVRELCSSLGFKSTATAQYYVNKLENNGLISKRNSQKRALTLLDKKKPNARMIPEVGIVTAGEPIFTVENLVGYYPLPDDFENYEDAFVLKVSGTSMINAGILDGDKIIVQKTPYCEDGDIIVALVDDSATCKRFYKRNGKIVLHPENELFEDMIFDKVDVLGKVVGLIRKF